MTKTPDLGNIEALLTELLALLQAEGESDRFPGLNHAVALARQAPVDITVIPLLKSAVRTLYGGSGMLNDLVIWRDSVNDRKVLNDRLDSLRARLFEAVTQL